MANQIIDFSKVTELKYNGKDITMLVHANTGDVWWQKSEEVFRYIYVRHFQPGSPLDFTVRFVIPSDEATLEDMDGLPGQVYTDTTHVLGTYWQENGTEGIPKLLAIEDNAVLLTPLPSGYVGDLITEERYAVKPSAYEGINTVLTDGQEFNVYPTRVTGSLSNLKPYEKGAEYWRAKLYNGEIVWKWQEWLTSGAGAGDYLVITVPYFVLSDSVMGNELIVFVQSGEAVNMAHDINENGYHVFYVLKNELNVNEVVTLYSTLINQNGQLTQEIWLSSNLNL